MPLRAKERETDICKEIATEYRSDPDGSYDAFSLQPAQELFFNPENRARAG